MGKKTHPIKAKQEKPQIAKKDEESEEVLNCLEDQIPCLHKKEAINFFLLS